MRSFITKYTPQNTPERLKNGGCEKKLMLERSPYLSGRRVDRSILAVRARTPTKSQSTATNALLFRDQYRDDDARSRSRRTSLAVRTPPRTHHLHNRSQLRFSAQACTTLPVLRSRYAEKLACTVPRLLPCGLRDRRVVRRAPQ